MMTTNVPIKLEVTGLHFENWSKIIVAVNIEVHKYLMTVINEVNTSAIQQKVDNIVTYYFSKGMNVTFFGRDGCEYRLFGIKLEPDYENFSLNILPIWEVL